MSPTALALRSTAWDQQPLRAPAQNQISPRNAFAVDTSAAALTRSDPWWVFEVDLKLRALAQLQSGWDGYQAEVINQDALEFARVLLSIISVPNLPSPHIAPLASGGLQIEWHEKGLDLEIEITEPYAISYYFEDHVSGEEIEQSIVDTDFTSLLQGPLNLLVTRE